MGLGLSGAFGAVGAMQGLRAIQDRAIEEQQRQQLAAQQELRNNIALRDITEREAAGAFDRRPITLTPVRQSGLVGSSGQKATIGFDPQTGKPIYELPEYEDQKPEATRNPITVRGARGKTGAPVTQFRDPVTLQLIDEVPEYQEPQKPGGMTDAGRFGSTLRLQNDFEKATAEARTMRGTVSKMDRAVAALNNGDNSAVPPAAEAIQVIFQKMLDPTSVVREGEFARSMLTQPLTNRIRGAVDRLATGGTGIPISELKEYASLARQFADAANQDASTIRTRTKRTAERFGLNPDDIFMDDVGVVKQAPLSMPPAMAPLGSRQQVGTTPSRPPGVPVTAVWTVDAAHPQGYWKAGG